MAEVVQGDQRPQVAVVTGVQDPVVAVHGGVIGLTVEGLAAGPLDAQPEGVAPGRGGAVETVLVAVPEIEGRSLGGGRAPRPPTTTSCCTVGRAR